MFAPQMPLTESKQPKTLPKTLPGAVCRQWVSCGKGGCSCVHGKLHSPYFYRFWREGGRLRKEYVKRVDADEVAARCQARRQLRTERNDSLDEFRRLLATLREIERNGSPY